MQITYRNNRWEAISSFSEKDILKGAGFRWDVDAKRWFTTVPDVAEEFRDKADETARAELDSILEKIARSRSAKMATGVDIPAPNGKRYFPYQHSGIAFAIENEATFIGDEMGLGKTIQAIGVINATRPQTVLIICPATLKLNWEKELRNWLVPEYRITVVGAKTGFPENPGIVILNYDIAGKYSKEIHAREWGVFIADEAHYLKNQKAQRTQVILGHGKKQPGVKAAKKIVLTGTPITNRPVELWPLASYLWPLAFNNYFHFTKRYCGAYNDGWGWDVSGADNLEELQNLLRSSGMIRRLKADVLTELPPKTRQVVILPSDSVRSLVERESKEMAKHESEIKRLKRAVKAAKAQKDDAAYREAVANLRGAHNVAFTEMAVVRKELAIAKIPFAVEYVNSIIGENEKVVVMAHHREVVDQLQQEFGLAAVKLYGGMSEADKFANVDRFQNDPSCKIFIGSIRAAGVGITLTAAQKMLFAELDWTPANMLQAEDRIHRIGQTGNALIQQLVFDGSLDAKMADTLVRKMEIIEQALDRMEADEPVDAFED